MAILAELRRHAHPRDTNAVNGISLNPKVWAKVTLLMNKYGVNRSRLVDIALAYLFEHLDAEIADLEAGTTSLDPADALFHQNAEARAARIAAARAVRLAAEAKAAEARAIARAKLDAAIVEAAVDPVADADEDLAYFHRAMADDN